MEASTAMSKPAPTGSKARAKQLEPARHKAGSHAGPHGGYPVMDKKSARAAIALANMHGHPEIAARARSIAEHKGLLGKKSEHEGHMQHHFHGGK